MWGHYAGHFLVTSDKAQQEAQQTKPWHSELPWKASKTFLKAVHEERKKGEFIFSFPSHLPLPIGGVSLHRKLAPLHFQVSSAGPSSVCSESQIPQLRMCHLS